LSRARLKEEMEARLKKVEAEGAMGPKLV